MKVGVYRDLFAIHFVRCLTPIPGSDTNAAGSGLTLRHALARCESEVAERAFELHELAPAGVHHVGIAAHLDYPRAESHALQETIETLCLRQVHAEGALRCLLWFGIGGWRCGVSRTERGYFCMMTGRLRGEPVAAYTAAVSFFGALLKTWEEYRSIQFFKPSGTHLKNYSKAQKLFSASEFETLQFQFDPRFVYSPDLSELRAESAVRSGRTIVYYSKKAEK